LTILRPLQKLPSTSQGVPASSTTTFGSMAFQLSVSPMFEQRTCPWSAQLPLAWSARVDWPMQETFLPNVEAA
jgi:hypothetical protein